MDVCVRCRYRRSTVAGPNKIRRDPSGDPLRVRHDLFRCAGGALSLPDTQLTLIGREDGGHLIADPPRVVWERSLLSVTELGRWSALVAATGAAMLEVLPQLRGGCINYWEAGNWALHDDAEPPGRKEAAACRRVHLHLFGRSPDARDPDWLWGEAPRFPRFSDRMVWAAKFDRLTAPECEAVVTATEQRLRDVYGFAPSEVERWVACNTCGYPRPSDDTLCGNCQDPRP